MPSDKHSHETTQPSQKYRPLQTFQQCETTKGVRTLNTSDHLYHHIITLPFQSLIPTLLGNDLCNISIIQCWTLENHINPRHGRNFTPSFHASKPATTSPQPTSTPTSPSDLFHLHDLSHNLHTTSTANPVLQDFEEAHERS